MRYSIIDMEPDLIRWRVAATCWDPQMAIEGSSTTVRSILVILRDEVSSFRTMTVWLIRCLPPHPLGVTNGVIQMLRWAR